LASFELNCSEPPEPEIHSQEETHQRFAAVCKALAHPVRVHIVSHLRKIDRCICGKIVDTLPLAQSTVSQHLKILKASGLVRGEIQGPKTCYCLDPAVMKEFKEFVDKFISTDT